MLLFVGTGLQAQKVDWGVSVGMSYNRLFVDNATTEQAHIGAIAGLYYKRFISNDFWVQPSVRYTGKGGNMRFEDFDMQSAAIGVNLHYVDIPFWFGHQASDYFQVFAGPYVGRILHVSISLDSGELEQFDAVSYANLNGTDYGIQIGFGLSFPLGIQINLVLSAAMREVDTDAVRPLMSGMKNTNAMLIVGFNF